MSAGVEDRVEVSLLDAVEADRLGELGFRCCIGLEAAREVGLEARLVALGIERRLPALGRGKHDLGAGILEGVVGRGELLEPEAGLAAGVAKLVVEVRTIRTFMSLLLSLAG